MTEEVKSLTYLKVENSFEGVKIYNTETEVDMSISNAEMLHGNLGNALATAAGYQQLTMVAADVEPGQKLVINGTGFKVKNVLSGHNDTITLQWQDYFGEPGEITVPEDFEVLVWERIE